MKLDIDKHEEISKETRDWIIEFGLSIFTASVAVAFRERLTDLVDMISKRKVE